MKETDSGKEEQQSCCDFVCCQGPPGPPGPAGEANLPWFYSWQTGTLRNSALFGGLRFEHFEHTQEFYYDDTILYIMEPGIYHVRYTIFVPRNVALNTTAAMQSNNVNLPGMIVDIDHPAGDASAVYSSEGILRVGEELAAMRLSSSRNISYTGQNDSVTLASISIIRIGS